MPNPNGDTGNSTTVVLGDKVVVVGDNPNTNPSVYSDPTGKETNSYGFSGSSGLINTKTAIPTFTPIDNAGDFHGGNYTIVAMNGIHFEAGGGGLSADINGNMSLSSWGGMINITSTSQASVQAQVVQLAATNTILLSGPSLYVNTAETVFNKNVTFGNNVIINGGLAVNGELFVSHLTALHSVNFTEESDELYGYPIMGAEFAVNIMPQAPQLVAPPFGINSPELTIDGGMPPGNYIMRIIPYYPIKAFAPDAIVATPPHEHLYNGIGGDGVESPSDLRSEMKAIEGDTPVQAKPNLIDGLSPKDLGKKIKDKIEKRLQDFVEKILGIPIK